MKLFREKLKCVDFGPMIHFPILDAIKIFLKNPKGHFYQLFNACSRNNFKKISTDLLKISKV